MSFIDYDQRSHPKVFRPSRNDSLGFAVAPQQLQSLSAVIVQRLHRRGMIDFIMMLDYYR